ncbi:MULTISPECIES: alpha-E domain-containing protein [Sphingosinicellaceae]|uniref:alpha-E domain-containing protein n=1 Tax=Sphingosinicellaceae TaxID=2820280 RepID=UPI001C1E319D|nr:MULTISPECIES: alpha-E domain-containing protein [Polymorphobacter]QYE35446.1 alpha-E domain-containing protein [Polymorphobacter sp. PAMC 29334]UAJ11244.1 alpha-E domain-containing protein [Polymorphobacter megasporae]
MLSRTAGNLYWVGRYIERADFLSRLIEATLRLASLPSSYGGMTNAWESALEAAWMTQAHAERGLAADEFGVSEFLTVDPTNPSSIRRCLECARANARAVRTALTLEAWEAINGAWLDVQRYGTRLEGRDDLVRLLDTVKASMLAFDGAAHRTMLRGDAYWFIMLGSAVERADNTARLLDVKYHLLLPRGEKVGGSLDYFQWTTILRTVSALTAYRWVYRDSVKPWLIADLLILNRQIPRSLASCYEEILRRLDQLSHASARRGPAHRLASAGYGRLESGNIDKIYSSGLHEFLRDFIADNNRLGAAIAEQYLF